MKVFKFTRWILLIASVSVLMLACNQPLSFTSSSADFLESYGPSTGQESIEPLHAPEFLEAKKVELGDKLFHEKRLSKDGTLACASCHSLDTGGVDQQPHSTGVGGAQGGINAPTVLNAALNIKQFWNGRAEDLKAQAGGPVTNPKEMAAEWPAVCATLKKDDEYVKAFAELYPQGICQDSITDAIAYFEQSLITVDSRFDRYLKGDSSALNDLEKRGWRNFKEFGCASCHQGANVGGNLFAKLGMMGDYFTERGNPTDADDGRYAVSKRERDRNVFKVPSLRNIANTGPYFHDASAENLPSAIETMAKYQLGRYVDVGEVKSIEAFLRTLSGEVKK